MNCWPERNESVSAVEPIVSVFSLEIYYNFSLFCRFTLLTIMITIGLIGNTLSVFTLKRPSFSHSSTTPFLIALGVCDNIEMVTGRIESGLLEYISRLN